MQSPPPKPQQSSLNRLAPLLAVAGTLVYFGVMTRLHPMQDPLDESETGEKTVKLLPGDPEHQLEIRGAKIHGKTEFNAIQVGMTFNQVRSIMHVRALTREDKAEEIVTADESRISFVSGNNSAIEVLLRKGIVAEKHRLSPEMRNVTEQMRKVDTYP